MSDRKEVKVYIEDFYCNYYEMFNAKSPDDVIKWMTDLKKEYEGRNIYFNVVYTFTGAKEFQLWETRLENDKEYDKRLKDEAKEIEIQNKLKLRKEKEERKEYLRLKKKYG